MIRFGLVYFFNGISTPHGLFNDGIRVIYFVNALLF